MTGDIETIDATTAEDKSDVEKSKESIAEEPSELKTAWEGGSKSPRPPTSPKSPSAVSSSLGRPWNLSDFEMINLSLVEIIDVPDDKSSVEKSKKSIAEEPFA